MSINMSFWYDENWANWAKILFTENGNYAKVWPFSDANATMAQKLNAISRITIYISILLFLLSLLRGHALQGIIVLMLGAIVLVVIVMYGQRRISKPLQIQTETIAPAGEFLSGVYNSVHNPYGNPTEYDPGIAVRSAKPAMDYIEDDSLRKIYRGTGEIHPDLFYNRIPDPTLIARPVFWPQDPRPDIVSNEAACGDRLCR